MLTITNKKNIQKIHFLNDISVYLSISVYSETGVRADNLRYQLHFTLHIDDIKYRVAWLYINTNPFL